MASASNSGSPRAKVWGCGLRLREVAAAGFNKDQTGVRRVPTPRTVQASAVRLGPNIARPRESAHKDCHWKPNGSRCRTHSAPAGSARRRLSFFRGISWWPAQLHGTAGSGTGSISEAVPTGIHLPYTLVAMFYRKRLLLIGTGFTRMYHVSDAARHRPT